jgi:AcrR family transcriptional regulator
MERQERLQQIEMAAGRLFSERGYAGTSVRDIARELDMQGGSLYAHISSKEEVLWRIVQRAGSRFHEAIVPIVAERLAPLERLRRMSRAHVGVITADPRHASVFLHEWRYLQGAWQRKARGLRDGYERHFRQAVEEGMEAGSIRAVDPGLVARFLLSSLNGIAIWYRRGGDLTPDQIADECVELFVDGLTR